MSTPLTFAGYAQFRADPERWHRRRMALSIALLLAMFAALAAYGATYYWQSSAERPFHPLHSVLKPGGSLGIKLGMLGTAMFLVIFVYALRKRWKWLGRQGSSRHWLDFHIVLGLSAPAVIAFHAAFKFRGIAGVAFWIMLAVALSGIIGRYLYAQIPRSLNSAELSQKELFAQQETLARELSEQHILHAADLAPIFAVPTTQEIQQMSALRIIATMIRLDVARPFHVARLRSHALGLGGRLLSLGGVIASSDRDLERIIATAKRRSALAKRVAFLQRTHRVFHLWHVVHRPFSYSFAVLALLHIGVVTLLGFF